MIKAVMLCLIGVFFLGCGDVDEPAPMPDAGADGLMTDMVVPPDLLPSKIDPVQACYDIAKWLGDKLYECTHNGDLADKMQKTLEDNWDCSSITGLRDGIELYTVCRPAIENLTCTEFMDGDVPKSCENQLL